MWANTGFATSGTKAGDMGPPSEILRAVTRVNSGYGSGALGASAICHAGRGVGRPYGCAGGAVVGIAHDRYRQVHGLRAGRIAIRYSHRTCRIAAGSGLEFGVDKASAINRHDLVVGAGGSGGGQKRTAGGYGMRAQ